LLRQVVRLSVCPSVCTLVDYGHTGWNSSKIMSLLSVRSLQFQTSRIYSKGNTRNFGRNGWGMEKVAFVRSTKALISLKRGKIKPRLLLRTNRKSHAHFQQVPESTTLDDFEGLLRTLLRKICVFRSQRQKCE